MIHRCNYCNVKAIEKLAAETGATVHRVASPLMPKTPRPGIGFPDGVDIFVVLAGEQLDTSKDAKGNHGKQWRMWAAKIPDHCVC